MSYVRFAEDSDVYIWNWPYSYAVCQNCRMLLDVGIKPHSDGSDFHLAMPIDVLRHMTEHVARGHKVPASAFESILNDIREWGPFLERAADEG